VQDKDPETGENYLSWLKIRDPLQVYEVNGVPLNVTIPLPPDHDLRTCGAVLYDEETGIPTWNKKKVSSVRLWAIADTEQGGRPSITPRMILGQDLVHANEKGQLPLWDSCMVNSIFDWIATHGDKKPEVNIAKLGAYRFHSTPYSRKLAALNASIEANKDTSGGTLSIEVEQDCDDEHENNVVDRLRLYTVHPEILLNSSETDDLIVNKV